VSATSSLTKFSRFASRENHEISKTNKCYLKGGFNVDFSSIIADKKGVVNYHQ
jgi:hypothetical protein